MRASHGLTAIVTLAIGFGAGYYWANKKKG